MDASRLGPGQVILGAGAVVLIVSLFLDWISATVEFGATTITASGSAFDVFSGMDIIMLIIGVAALLFAGLAAMEGTSVPEGASIVVAVLGLIVFGWALGWDLENSQAGIGAWLALFASAAIAYGAYASTTSGRPADSRPARRPPRRSPTAGTTSGPSGGSTPPPGS